MSSNWEWDKVTISRDGAASYRIWFERQKTTDMGLTTTDVTVRELGEADSNMLFLLDALYDIVEPEQASAAIIEVNSPGSEVEQ